MQNIKVKPKIIQDTFYTLTPVNNILRIFVLANVKRVKCSLVESWCLCENLIVLSSMTTINIFLLYTKITGFEAYTKNTSLKFIDTLQLTYLLGFSEYILDLVFVYKCRKTKLQYLHFYADIDKVLGTPDFKAIRTKNVTAVLSLVLNYLGTIIFDFASWCLGYGLRAACLYFVDYVYNFINALTVLDLVSNVTQIEYRLKVMIHILEEFYASSSSLSENEEHWALVPGDRVSRLRIVSHDKNFGVLLLSKCYVLLNEQVNYINKSYGIRVGGFCLILLINLIYLTNIIIRVTLGLISLPEDLHKLPAFSTSFRIINYTAVVLIMVRSCQQTYNQCDSIVRLIDLTLINKKISAELKAALQELRNLIVSRPVRFHGGYFFTLDCPLLVSIASVVVTYTIILLQSMS